MTQERPLRVLVAAVTMVPGEMGGSETMARGLLGALAERDDVEVTTLVNRAGRGVLPAEREVVVTSLAGGAGTAQRVATLARGLLPDASVRAAVAAADVVHHPFTVPVPRSGRTPHTVALLDVQHRDLPHMFSRAERAYRAVAYDRAARRADRVITISEFSRTRIVETLGLPADRVVAIPLGVDLSSYAAGSGPREAFVYYPARAWPHKNHARLVEAMTLVRRTRPDLRLVLTGGGRDGLGTLPDWVEHRGHVSEEEVRSLYARAACLAFPSLYEGFGLPVLEAMASGCPVAAADAGSLPEVCGDAAVLFDPLEPEDVARGIESALSGGERLASAGLERVGGFTWRQAADRYASTLRQAT